MQMYIKNKNPR